MLTWLRKKRNIGFRLFWHDTVTSTNDVLKALAEKGEAEGAVVIAEGQTAGRGRLNRTWISPRGAGLYFSILLRPRLSAQVMDFLPIVAGVAVANVLKRNYRLQPQLKWPNDVLFAGRKVCGILCESKRRAVTAFAVIGIGINVEPIADAYPVGVRERSIALKTVAAAPVDKLQLLQDILAEMNKVYPLAMERRQKVMERWLYFCGHLNKEVMIRQPDRIQTGFFRGIDERGAAVIEWPNSELAVFESGEISIEEHMPCY